jgi:hypothetical protein
MGELRPPGCGVERSKLNFWLCKSKGCEVNTPVAPLKLA